MTNLRGVTKVEESKGLVREILRLAAALKRPYDAAV